MLKSQKLEILLFSLFQDMAEVKKLMKHIPIVFIYAAMVVQRSILIMNLLKTFFTLRKA